MARAASSRRYAQAVFQIALERDALEVWTGDLKVLATWLENRELAGLLNAPQIPAAAKVQTIDDLLGDSVDQLAKNLLAVLATRNLAYLLSAVADEFSRLVDEQSGIIRGEVVSAILLNDDQSDSIAQVLSDLVGSPVRLLRSIDTGIIGGIVARVGDRVIDGSVLTKLREMRRSVAKETGQVRR